VSRLICESFEMQSIRTVRDSMEQSNPGAGLSGARAGRAYPICESGEGEVLHTQRFVLPEDHPLGDGYDVVCCPGCGFVFANTTATQDDYDAFYARLSKYEDNVTSTGGGGTAWDAARMLEMGRDIAGFVPDTTARIVDIGCANGGGLAALKTLGYDNLCGIDPSPACAKFVRVNHGIEAYAGSLTELPEETGPADAVPYPAVYVVASPWASMHHPSHPGSSPRMRGSGRRSKIINGPRKS
jgi:hypothetical protein